MKITAYNSDRLPVIQINNTIAAIEAVNKRLSIMLGIAQPIRYTTRGGIVELLEVSKKIRGNFVIPYGVEILAMGAFQDCIQLTSVEMPESLKEIRDYAFAGCRSINYIYIPDSVESVRNFAFDKCLSLANVSIPKGVDILYYAFGFDSNTVKIRREQYESNGYSKKQAGDYWV